MRQGSISYFTNGHRPMLRLVDREEYKLYMRIEPCRDQWRFEIAREISGVESSIELYLEADELAQLKEYINGTGQS